MPRHRQGHQLVAGVFLCLLAVLAPQAICAQETGRAGSEPPPPPSATPAASEVQLTPPAPDEKPGFWATFAHTTPFGLSTTPGAGAWGGTVEGTKRILSEGRPTLLVSGYAWHLPWKHKTERQKAFNDAAWGAGFGWEYGENDRRRRIAYVLANDDSHNKMEYMAGYAWVARWHPYGGIRLGAGYTLSVIGRHEYNYIPAPLILPAFSAGADRAEVFATYVPYGEVILFLGRFTF